jgi:hypothetical protein
VSEGAGGASGSFAFGLACELAAARRVGNSGWFVRSSVGWGRSSHSTSTSSGGVEPPPSGWVRKERRGVQEVSTACEVGAVVPLCW